MPAHIAAGGGFVWTTNFEDGTISRIDPTTNMAVAFDVGEEPTYLAVGSFEVTHGGTNVVVYADPEPGATGQEPPKIQNTLSFNAHVKGIADAFGKLAIFLDDGRLLHYDRESGVTTEGMGPGVPSSGLAFGDGHLIVYAPTDDTILVSGPGPDKSWVSRGNFHPAAFAAYDNVLYVTGGNGDVLSDPLSGRPNTRVIGHVPPPAADVIVAPKTPDQGGNEAVASPEVLQSVPPAILGDALQNPQHIAGWGQPINPNLPAGPNNPPAGSYACGTRVSPTTRSATGYWSTAVSRSDRRFSPRRSRP